MSAGDLHSVALAADGTAYAWGHNRDGQLGNTTTEDSHLPEVVRLPDGVTVTQLSAGDSHSVALAADGTAYAWGQNLRGQLGHGNTEGSLVPVRVRVPDGGDGNAGGRRCDAFGRACRGRDRVCLGANSSGQLGDGSNTVRTAPTPVPTETTDTGVSFGGASATGLVDNGNGTWTATTAPHAAGPVDVTVSWAMNGVAQPDCTRAGAFTYVVPDVAPTVTDPADQSVTAGDTAAFTVEADGTRTPAIAWAISADHGATWDAISASDGTVSGGGTTLTVVATEALSGALYRATATNSAGADTSAAATLTIVPGRAVIADEGEAGNSGGVGQQDLAHTGSDAGATIAAGMLAMFAGTGLALAARRKRGYVAGVPVPNPGIGCAS